MWEILSWLFFIIFIAGLLVVGGLLLRGYLTTGSATGAFQNSLFPAKPEKRLGIVDQENIDGRRRLVLIRRDDVEHLIMTGGPVDVVIETGVGARSRSDPRFTNSSSAAPQPSVGSVPPSAGTSSTGNSSTGAASGGAASGTSPSGFNRPARKLG